MTDKILIAENIHCGYGKTEVVKGISLTLNKGELITIAGINGCGKTTFLRALCGVIPITAGKITVGGKDISTLKRKEIARCMALFSQNSTALGYTSYTVEETVMLGRYALLKGGPFSSPNSADKEFVRNCMERTGVYEFRNKHIDELSGGQLQRVMLSKAFAQNPDIMLLDEPANHLDLRRVSQLIDIIKEWLSEGHSAVGVFHDLSMATAVSDRILLMDNGKTAFEGTPAEVINSDTINNIYGINVKEYMRDMFRIWE